MSYRVISDFAPNVSSVAEDPLTYCLPDVLNSQFLHGGVGRTFGKGNRSCAEYMASYCANSWNEVCDAASENKSAVYPDMTENNDGACVSGPQTAGNLLVKDTAYKKYLLNPSWDNVSCEPFDPTVPNSPFYCYIAAPGLTKYGLTDAQIDHLDEDEVMERLICNPDIAPDLLTRIYVYLKSSGKMDRVSGKRLGQFFKMNGM
jgi:hypothetical protein